MSYNTMVNLIHITGKTTGRVWVQFDDDSLPFFRIAWRAWLSHGHVVKMTPRALARFQSFPDDYVLPDSNRLACKIIGNAVPPLMYQKIVAGLLR